MPRNRVLLVAALLGASTAAAAEPKFGVTFDVGVPDGANAALVFRPVSQLRLHAGASHNAVSYGARGGITLVPFSTWLSPTLSFDYGMFSDGNANPVVQMVTGDGSFSSSVLERFGYRYANAHLGIELGRERATFYLHAGLSYVTGTLHGLSEAIQGDDDMSSTQITFEDPTFATTTLSARVGVILFL